MIDQAPSWLHLMNILTRGPLANSFDQNKCVWIKPLLSLILKKYLANLLISTKIAEYLRSFKTIRLSILFIYLGSSTTLSILGAVGEELGFP